MLAVFDNEEIGSLTRRGRTPPSSPTCSPGCAPGFGKGEEDKLRAIQGGMLLSADNAHGVHPSYPEKYDPTNRCYLNGGVVVKHSTRYATDAVTAGVFQRICELPGCPPRPITTIPRSRGVLPWGTCPALTCPSPRWTSAWPSFPCTPPYETAGAEDLGHMIAAMTAFYNTPLRREGDGSYSLG